MFDQGSHAVLRGGGVCVVLKTPTDDMPQVEYWGAISPFRQVTAVA